MLKRWRKHGAKKLSQGRSFLIAKLSKILLHLLFKTCRIHVKGRDQFVELATKEKCILILWHNRIALALFILSQYTPSVAYAALVSGSRDGDILSSMIHSYKNGTTIRVPHIARYKALQDMIRHANQRKGVVIITPDGPRGPCYEIKPGVAIAALETEAHMVCLNWEAKRYWELDTWDKLRLPKPFTSIWVTFENGVSFCHAGKPSVEEAQRILKEILPKKPG